MIATNSRMLTLNHATRGDTGELPSASVAIGSVAFILMPRFVVMDR